MAAVESAVLTIGATRSLIVQADVDGCVVVLHHDANGNHGMVIGGATVTAGTGFALHSGTTNEFRLPPNGALYGVRSDNQDVTLYALILGNA